MRLAIVGVLSGVLGLAALSAQAPPQPAPSPDTPDITARIERLKHDVGPRWQTTVHFWCEDPRANRPDDPPIPPTRVFDDVFAIGNSGTTVYVLRTPAGLIMIDALGAGDAAGTTAQLDAQLLPGFQRLGLDPSQVKIVLVTHGHADHFGGASYFQEHFGSKIYVSAADWNLMENPPAGRGGEKKGPPAVLPKHDQVVTEGQPIVLGDLHVMPVAIPGHTPGSMGYIFPVKDQGKTRIAAIYGGTILTPGIISNEGLQTYLKSVAHFKEETKKAKVEVEIQNHPLMDPIQKKLDRLDARKKGEPNPFVVGAANYQKFVDVMSLCTQVNIARRK
jgi:metallo-beta-lactamase class B